MSENPNAQVPLHLLSEESVAQRIEYEMERRGWSQERMAKEMTDAGHPLHQSAISKIIRPKEGRRRLISVDEAIGFAKVFGVSIEEMTTPLQVVFHEEIRDVLGRLAELGQQREATDLEAMRLVNRMFKLVEEIGGEDELHKVLDQVGTGVGKAYLEELLRWRDAMLSKLKAAGKTGVDEEEAMLKIRQELTVPALERLLRDDPS